MVLRVLSFRRGHLDAIEQHEGMSRAVPILMRVQMNAGMLLTHRKVQTANSF